MAIDLLTLAQFERAVEVFLTRFDPSQGTLTTFSGNLNALATDGFYVVEVSATNKPSSVTTGVVVVFTPESNKILQVFFDVAGDNQNALYRSSVNNGSTWSAWVDFATVIGNAATTAANAVTANLQSLLNQATMQATTATNAATTATNAATNAAADVRTTLQGLVDDAENAKDDAEDARDAAQTAAAATGANPQFAQYDAIIAGAGTIVPSGTTLYPSLTAYFDANQTSNGHRILVTSSSGWSWRTSNNITNTAVIDGTNRRAHANTNLTIEGVGASAQVSSQGPVSISGHGWKVRGIVLQGFFANDFLIGGDDHDWDVWSGSSNQPGWVKVLGARDSFRAVESVRTSTAEIDTIFDQTPLKIVAEFTYAFSSGQLTNVKNSALSPNRFSTFNNTIYTEHDFPLYILPSSADTRVRNFVWYAGLSYRNSALATTIKSRWFVIQCYDLNGSALSTGSVRLQVFI